MSKAIKAITGIIAKILPKTPKIELPSVAMPDPGSAASKLAMSKKMDARRARGRESTIYSGGGAYGGLNLGGTA